MVYANILALPLQHEPFFPLSFYTFYEWVLEGALQYEHRTRSFLFQKSKENPVFHHMCPLSHVYLEVIDFYDSYGDSCVHFVCHLVQAQKRRVGEAHVGPSGEQERTDGPAGRSHEAAEGTKLDNNLTLYFPRHVWKHHLFAHFFSSPFSFSPLSVWRICFHSLSYLIFWLTGWRAETGSKCSFNTALQFWSKHAVSQLQKFDLAYVLCMAKQNEWDFFPTKLWKQWKCYKYTLKLLHDLFDYHHITLKVRASFTKQGKLVWECNSKRAPMEVDISAGDY